MFQKFWKNFSALRSAKRQTRRRVLRREALLRRSLATRRV